MAEHIWTVLCSKMLVDPNNQTISLIDIAESLSIENLNQVLEEATSLGRKGVLANAEMQLVSWWHRTDPDEKELQARIELFDPAGESIFVRPVTMPWNETTYFLRINVTLNKVPVSAPGLCWFVVQQQQKSKSGRLRWVRVAKLPLHIFPG